MQLLFLNFSQFVSIAHIFLKSKRYEETTSICTIKMKEARSVSSVMRFPLQRYFPWQVNYMDFSIFVGSGVIIGKTLPLIFLPGVFPLKNFQNKTLPRVSEINFFNQMWNPPPSWENPPHRYCDIILHCPKILKNRLVFTGAPNEFTGAPLVYN